MLLPLFLRCLTQCQTASLPTQLGPVHDGSDVGCTGGGNRGLHANSCQPRPWRRRQEQISADSTAGTALFSTWTTPGWMTNRWNGSERRWLPHGPWSMVRRLASAGESAPQPGVSPSKVCGAPHRSGAVWPLDAEYETGERKS
ncbi:hypothetical protein QBC39DRAFT_342545 [Podospora conica]|nr:hypothetical protein QBC39DRAFT_342545 [Schizothecium conicum]